MNAQDSPRTPATGASSLPENAIRLKLPTSWADMPDSIWMYVCRLLGAGRPADEVQTSLVIRALGGPRIARYIATDQIAWASTQLDFLATPPAEPARPEYIGKVRGVDRKLHGVPFSVYLICENCYQGFIMNPQNTQAVDDLLNHLYPGYLRKYPEAREDELRQAARYIAVLWWTSLKMHFGQIFNSLFKSAGSSGQVDMRKVVAAQIRGLTGGDITKEQAVLRADVWTALTELDAKAREAQEMKSNSNS